MKRWVAMLMAAAAMPAVTACVQQVGPIVTAMSPTLTMTLQFPAGRAPFGRRVLALPVTDKVRVSVEGPDLAGHPFTPVEASLKRGASGESLKVKDVPSGDLRLVSVQWLDDAGQPVPGMVLRSFGPLDEYNRQLLFSQTTTVETEILADLLKNKPEAAGALSRELIDFWFSGVVARLNVPHPRLLDSAAMAVAMEGLTPKTSPSIDPAWQLKPGYVSVGFRDLPSHLRIEAHVDDPMSDAAESKDGDPLVMGPIVPREAPYTLHVRVLPTGDEAIGAELADRTVSVTVKAGETTTIPPIRFQASTAGAQALPEPTGHGGLAVVTGAEDQLWMVGGVKVDAAVPAVVSLTTPSTAVRKGFRYTRAEGWTAPVSLPLPFPVYGAATVASGTKIICVGGFLATGKPSKGVHVVDTMANTAQADVAQLPATLTEAAAALLNGQIYVVGGSGPAEGFNGMYVLNPDTLATQPAGITGDFVSLKAPASVVVGGKWYLFGGYPGDGQPIVPSAEAQAMDGGTKAWVALKPMPTPRNGATAVAVDGKIWVIGGEERRGAPSRAVEVYDPAADTWTRRAPLATPRSYPAVAVVKVDGKSRLVIAGGVSGLSPLGFPMPLAPDAVEEIAP